MLYILVIISLFIWSCEQDESDNISDQAPEITDICDNEFSDVDGSLLACDAECSLVDGGEDEYCYHSYDLQVLNDIIFMNDSVFINDNTGYSELDVGWQDWSYGRLVQLDLSYLGLNQIPANICNLVANTDSDSTYLSVRYNNLCPEYQFECLENVGMQNIANCNGFSEYGGIWYYDNHLDILSDIKDLNPSLQDYLLLDIGFQDWYNGQLIELDISDLELVSLPSSICNLSDCIINVDNNQLCQEYQYDCIDQWGTQAGLDIMDDCGVCNGNNEDIDVCGVCFGTSIDPDNCCEEQIITSSIEFDGYSSSTSHQLDISNIGDSCHAMLVITLDGDYGDYTEYADVYLENYNNNILTLGTDYDSYGCDCRTIDGFYGISNSELNSYSSNGFLDILIQNTSAVDAFCDNYYYDYCGGNAADSNNHKVELHIVNQGSCFNDSDNDGICDNEDDCPDDPYNTDQDNDGLCDDIDPCPDDPLNECFPEEGFTYIWTFDWYCTGSPGQSLVTFLADGTWIEESSNLMGTWDFGTQNNYLNSGLCSSASFDSDLRLTFNNYNTYYYWDLEGNMGSDSIEGYHDDTAYNGVNVDGLSTLTLYNATFHGDINKIHQTSNFNPALIKNIDQEK